MADKPIDRLAVVAGSISKARLTPVARTKIETVAARRWPGLALSRSAVSQEELISDMVEKLLARQQKRS